MILIKNARILTQNTGRDCLEGYDILIDGSRITKISKNIAPKEKPEEIIDASHHLILPGMVNTHTHLPMTLLRGAAEDMKLEDWLGQMIWPMEGKFGKGDYYWGAMLGCLENIRFGTTTFSDMYFHVDEISDAVVESGLRACLAGTLMKTPGVKFTAKDAETGIKDIRARKCDRLLSFVAPHSIYTCSKDALLEAKALAEKYDTQLHIHLSETRKEVADSERDFGMRPAEYLQNIEFLGSNVIAAHCVWLSKKEVGILAKTKTKVSYNPTSNMKLASGSVAPIPEMLASNVCVTLGTDGCASNNNLDMFEEMKYGALQVKAQRWDATQAKAQEVFDFATINGAEALGLDCGSIKEGKLADLLIVDLRKPHLQPVTNLLNHAVYSMQGSDVDTVIVDGKVLMRDRAIAGVDESKVYDKCQAIYERLVSG